MASQPRPTEQTAIGVDVGGTTVKGAVVDVAIPRVVVSNRLPTPTPALVDDVLDVVASVISGLVDQHGAGLSRHVPIGVAVPGDVRDGRHTSGVNPHPSWVGAPVRDDLEARLGQPVHILNDADAAGIAEVRFGAGAGVRGVVVVLTFGTGIGSGVFLDGRLLPNSGLGQFPFHGADVELSISAVARERRGIAWRQWAAEVNEFLGLVDSMLRPDLIVVGGGASESWAEYETYLAAPCPLARALFGNAAGVIGAAASAARVDVTHPDRDP